MAEPRFSAAHRERDAVAAATAWSRHRHCARRDRKRGYDESRRCVSPGAIISVYGSDLVPKVSVEGQDVQVLYASPTQINAVLPLTVTGRNCPGGCTSPRIAEVTVGNASRIVQFLDMTPGIFAATVSNGAVTVWMTGLGTGEKDISATIAGLPVTVLYRGMSPEFPGLYQVNLTVPQGTSSGSQRVEVAGAQIMVMLP